MKRLLYILLPIIAILVGCNGSDTDKMLSSVDSIFSVEFRSQLAIAVSTDNSNM